MEYHSINTGENSKLQNSGIYAKGDLLLGKYEVLDEPLRGGKGVVYKVRNIDSGFFHAAKTVIPEIYDESLSKLDSFIQEINNLIDLPYHPHIVQIDFIKKDDEGLPFIFMEYVQGESLRTRLLQKKKCGLEKEKALNIAYQICVGMEHIHNKGKVLHLDLKPENILLDQNGIVKICDFGLAKPSFSLTRKNKQFLTSSSLFYESPEIVNHEIVDTWSDIYSFGIILFELFTGKYPYPFLYLENENFDSLKTLKNELQRFHGSNYDFHDEFSHQAIIPDMSPEIGTILGHCLAKNHYKRINGFTYLKKWLIREYGDFIATNELELLEPNLYRKALNLQEIGQHSRAVDLLNSVLNQNPDNPAIWLSAAVSLTALEDHYSAKIFKEKARKLLSEK